MTGMSCCLFPPQTVERWTLGEIKAKYRAPANATGGASNATTLAPPPIPARRNICAQPQTQTGQTGQAAPQARPEDQPDNSSSKQESQSAPSSPTETSSKMAATGGGGGGAGGGVMKRLSPQQPTPRPRSVVDETKVTYTTVSFAEDGPPPTRRNNTTYTDIKHQPQVKATTVAASEEKEWSDGAGGDVGDDSNTSASYATVGGSPLRVQIPEDNNNNNRKSGNQNNEVLYDVPPPPVPVRFASQEAGQHENLGPAAAPAAAAVETSQPNPEDVSSDTATPTPPPPGDPFSHNQFNDPFSGSSWNDPSAFYDKPRSIVSAASITVETQEDGYFELARTTSIANSSTADFTGDSSYEDTSSFLRDIRDRYKGRSAEDILPTIQQAQCSNDVADGVAEEQAYDLPPTEQVTSIPPDIAVPVPSDVHMGSYDFPTALNRYPFREGGDGGGASSRPAAEDAPVKKSDEPPLHTIQYPMKAMPPTQLSVGSVSGGGPTSSPSVARSESFPRGRSNVPLPPTPLDQEGPASLDSSGNRGSHPPPLPARQPGPVGGGGGGGGASKPLSVRESSAPPLPPINERPRLPPFNHPWGNKRQARPPNPPLPSHDVHNPPLPPRKKAQGGANGQLTESTGSVTTPPQTAEDLAVSDLINKGYQQADIESALRIANNNVELAKSILKEFGGRH